MTESEMSVESQKVEEPNAEEPNADLDGLYWSWKRTVKLCGTLDHVAIKGLNVPPSQRVFVEAEPEPVSDKRRGAEFSGPGACWVPAGPGLLPEGISHLQIITQPPLQSAFSGDSVKRHLIAAPLINAPTLI